MDGRRQEHPRLGSAAPNILLCRHQPYLKALQILLQLCHDEVRGVFIYHASREHPKTPSIGSLKGLYGLYSTIIFGTLITQFAPFEEDLVSLWKSSSKASIVSNGTSASSRHQAF